jgi:hypothetical protein
MTEDPRRKALAVRPAPRNCDGDYDVGYGKPPVNTRFKAGQSGNPKGRPKGSSNKPKPPALNEERMKTILLQEAYRTIKVNEGSSQVSIPMAQAIIRSLAVNAVKGNQRAQRLFTELLTTTERENKRLHDEFLDVAITYKVEWERELERRERLGITGPEPLPHPDHVVVNMRTGEVAIKGPATKEEKAHHEMLVNAKIEFQAELDELEQLLDDEPEYPYRAQVEADIQHNMKLIDIIRKAVPD